MYNAAAIPVSRYSYPIILSSLSAVASICRVTIALHTSHSRIRWTVTDVCRESKSKILIFFYRDWNICKNKRCYQRDLLFLSVIIKRNFHRIRILAVQLNLSNLNLILLKSKLLLSQWNCYTERGSCMNIMYLRYEIDQQLLNMTMCALFLLGAYSCTPYLGQKADAPRDACVRACKSSTSLTSVT